MVTDLLGKMRKLKGVKDIVVHHSKSMGGSKSFLKYIHVEENNWSDIGYHFVLPNGLPMRDKYGRITWEAGKDGTVKIGRLTKWQGAHVKGHNRHSLSICLMGDFSKTHPTEKQISSLVSLLTALCLMYRLTPDHIWGHCDKGNSTCPGEYLYKILPEIREKVRLGLIKMNILKRVKTKLGWLGRIK